MLNIKSYIKNVLLLCLALAIPIIYSSYTASPPTEVTVEAYPIDGGMVNTRGQRNTLTVEAEEMYGYKFIGWYQNGQVISQDKIYTMNVESPVHLTAHFTKQVSINLDIENDIGGIVKGEGNYVAGEEIEIQAIPNVGYSFAGWVAQGEVISREPTLSLVPHEDTHLTATFQLDYKVDKPLEIKDGDYLLALVSKDTYLGDYIPSDLVQIDRKMTSNSTARYLRQEAYEQLQKMWEDAKKDGVSLYVVSGYRSYERQMAIFRTNASIRGEIEANRSSARAGESEHQLGTAVDFVGSIGDALSQKFAYTPPGKWLMLNAHKYGFAMSYPEGKEQVTGYIFEPWHYRYIGVEAAKEWSESGLTLKEFLMTQPQYFKGTLEFAQGN